MFMTCNVIKLAKEYLLYFPIKDSSINAVWSITAHQIGWIIEWGSVPAAVNATDKKIYRKKKYIYIKNSMCHKSYETMWNRVIDYLTIWRSTFQFFFFVNVASRNVNNNIIFTILNAITKFAENLASLDEVKIFEHTCKLLNDFYWTVYPRTFSKKQFWTF